MTEVIVAPDPAVQCAELIASRLAVAMADRSRASIAFSGGRTPEAMFDALSGMAVGWAAVDVFQVDERVAPDEDPARNWVGLRNHLLLPALVPEPRWHKMPVTDTNLGTATAGYSDSIRQIAPNGIDVVHLGLGEDGHTASWPPNDPVVRSGLDVDLAGPYQDHRRMTLTPLLINRVPSRIWLVAGRNKRAALKRLLEMDPTAPASHISLGRADTIFCDEGACP